MKVLTGYVYIKAAISEIPRNIRYRDSHAGYSRRESGPGWEGVGTVGYGVYYCGIKDVVPYSLSRVLNNVRGGANDVIGTRDHRWFDICVFRWDVKKDLENIAFHLIHILPKYKWVLYLKKRIQLGIQYWNIVIKIY